MYGHIGGEAPTALLCFSVVYAWLCAGRSAINNLFVVPRKQPPCLESSSSSASPSSRRVESKRAHLSPAVLFQRSKVSDVWVFARAARAVWFFSFDMVFWNDARMLTGLGAHARKERYRQVQRCMLCCVDVRVSGQDGCQHVVRELALFVLGVRVYVSCATSFVLLGNVPVNLRDRQRSALV